MATYRVISSGRGRVPDRDAKFVSVTAERDGTYLGQFQTSVSGIDLLAYTRTKPITVAQLWQLIAIELANAIKERAEGGQLRQEWHLDIESIPIDFDKVLSTASRQHRPVPDFAEGATVLEFTAP